MEAETTAENLQQPADSESHNVSEESGWKQIAEAGQEDVIRTQEKDLNHMESEYYEAAAAGNVDIFLNKKPELDKLLTPKDNTILHIHITARPKSSSINFVTKILEICPELLRKANTEGETLLHMAARHGHADIVQVLLEECKNPHQIDQENGTDPTCQMLGKINEAKDTALHEAVRYNHLDVVKILTAEGEHYKLSYDANSAGETPLYLAAERGYKDIVKVILDTCRSPAYSGPGNRTALHAAVICNDIDMTKWLLDKEMSLTTKADETGKVPLHYAAVFGYNEILESLLDKDKSTAYKADNKEQTALHVAVSHGKTEITKQLMSKCPDCSELVDKRGWNVLHFALHHGQAKTAKFVLENPSFGNLINQKDNKGNTPLFEHVASSLSYTSSFFVDHPKVDKLAFNCRNQNFLDIILADNMHEDKKFLRRLGSPQYRQRYSLVPKNEEGKSKQESVGRKCTDWKGKSTSDNMEDDDLKHIKETNLLVASLIATATFAAGFTVPGGTDGEGNAVLSGSLPYQLFFVCNSIAQLLSGFVVIVHLYVASSRRKKYVRHIMMHENKFLLVAAISMMLSYLEGIVAVTKGTRREKNILAWLATLSVLYPFLLILLVQALRLAAPVRVKRTTNNLRMWLLERVPLLRGLRWGTSRW